MTFKIAEYVMDIDFVLIRKERWHFLQNVKAIPGLLQHALVVADFDNNNIKEVVRKTCIERR